MTVMKQQRTHTQIPHPVLYGSRNVVVCGYCFENLGTLGPRMERRTLEARHVCNEKVLAGQPAAPQPFN